MPDRYDAIEELKTADALGPKEPNREAMIAGAGGGT